MRLFLVVVLSAFLASAGKPQEPPFPPPEKPETDLRLPNGKSQKDAIAKAEYEASVKDVHEMVRLAKDLEAELEKNESYVVSVASIRKTDDIEKLARRIRGRLKHY